MTILSYERGLSTPLAALLGMALLILVLPSVALLAFAGSTSHVGHPRTFRRWPFRLAFLPLVGSLGACGPGPAFESHAFIYNASQQVVLVDIARIRGLGCNTLDEFGSSYLERDDFESVGLFRLDAHETMPLDDRLDAASCECDVFRLTSQGRSIVLRVRPGSVSLPKRPAKDQVLEARARIVFVEPNTDPKPGEAFEILDIPFTAPEPNCTAQPRAMTFKTRVPQIESTTIESVKPVAGDCFEVITKQGVGTSGEGGAGGIASDDSTSSAGGAPNLGMAGQAGESGAPELGLAGQAGSSSTATTGTPGGEGGATSNEERIYICAPSDMFPFVPGDEVSVSTTVVPATDVYNLSINGSGVDTRSFSLFIGRDNPLLRAAGYAVSPALEACGPQRDEAHEPFVNARAQLDTGIAAQPLKQGEIMELLIGNRSALVYLGRARHYLHSEQCTRLAWLEVAESRL